MEIDTCGICGREADVLLLQSCFRCDTTYHLNPSSREPGIDCGDAILGAELGVYYYCNPCMEVINEEESAQAAQAMQMQFGSGVELKPGWRMPSMTDSAPADPAPPPAAPPPPRSPEAAPRRRFRRIDQ